MTTAWHHLPNARHLDRIIADLNANPDNWARAFNAVSYAFRVAARSATYSAARSAALDAALEVAGFAAGYAALDAAYSAATSAALDAAYSAILALIAWPEASDYLNLSVDSVRVLAALGDQRAILMLPAVIAFERSKESV